MDSRERYERLKHRFLGMYNRVKEYDNRKYIAFIWEGRREDTVAHHLLPTPPFDFLQRPVLRGSMSAGDKHTAHLLPELDSGWHPRAKYDHLRYDPLGHPEVAEFRGLKTDWGTIKQAHTLALLGKMTTFALSRLKSVVEWGAGYGCMPAMLHKKFGNKLTYVGIDLPLMSTLQWFYLACQFGEENVNLIYSPEGEVEKGKLNLLPNGLLGDVAPIGELFIALNSLNECSPAAWEAVANSGWFGSSYRVLRYHLQIKSFADFLESQSMSPRQTGLLTKHQYICWENAE